MDHDPPTPSRIAAGPPNGSPSIRSQAASLEQEHQSIVRDVLAAGDFWGGSGSVACQEFITQLGRNFQTIYEQANSHGQKVQTAGNNMSSTDSAVGGSWA